MVFLNVIDNLVNHLIVLFGNIALTKKEKKEKEGKLTDIHITNINM